MHRLILNSLLLAAFVALVLSVWLLRPDAARTNYEFLPQMVHTARYRAFSANPNFPDGTTLQAPVEGTVPRGLKPLRYTATPQDALRAGEELRAPFSSAEVGARERGAQVFANFCMVCHGPGGAGGGTVTQRGVPPPPSLLAEHTVKMKDGQMFHVLTYGQNNMASYASQLSREDRCAVILYIRSLQAAAQPPPATGGVPSRKAEAPGVALPKAAVSTPAAGGLR